MAQRVRSRTLAHLDTLLALTALATACHPREPGYGVVDPMPTPAQGDPPITPASTIPEASGTTPPPTVATPPTTTPITAPPDVGYGVVDPMPPPADCTTFPEAVYAYASWEDGAINLTVSAQMRYRGHASLGTSLPTIAHATVTAPSITSSAWMMKLTPDGSVHTLSFELTGTCENAPATARVRLNWEGTLTKDSRIEALVVADGK